MYRLFACLCTIVLLSGFRSPPPLPGPVVLSIIDREQGQPLPQYPHRGQRWIEGQPGHRYSIGLHNRSGQRVLVVVSVDGINAITGADATPAQSGYVLDPGERAEINGWRKSSTEVAQFVFTDNGDSYASRSGRPANVGVIGIAVFNEARPRPAPLADRLRDAAAAARMPAAAEAGADRAAMQSEGNSARQQLGTGHGRRESSVVATTGFERASTLPVQISELRYDAAARLVALGVVRTRLPPSPPRAFPGGFVPDPPPRWR